MPLPVPQDFTVGARVRILTSNEGLPVAEGIIAEMKPENAGALVAVCGLQGLFGWGLSELQVLGPALSAWERLKEEADIL